MQSIFESERLLFREFTIYDAALIYELHSDAEVMKYLHEPAITMESTMDILQNVILPQYSLYGYGRWAVHLKSSFEFIGWCGLKFIKEQNEIDIGYRFKKIFWNKGYATEAAKTCIGYGFEQLHLSEIIAKAHVENIGSLKVIKIVVCIFYTKKL